jgi:hypothetical protein
MVGTGQITHRLSRASIASSLNAAFSDHRRQVLTAAVAVSSTSAALMFSSGRCRFVVPGIGTIHGFCAPEPRQRNLTGRRVLALCDRLQQIDDAHLLGSIQRSIRGTSRNAAGYCQKTRATLRWLSASEKEMRDCVSS